VLGTPEARDGHSLTPGSCALASRGSRLVAAIIDGLLILSPVAAAFMLTQGTAESAETTAFRFRLWIGAVVLIGIVQLTLLSMRGQTLGKIAMSIRIVDYYAEANPGLVKLVLLRSLVPALIYGLPCLGVLFMFADWLSIFGEERRCIHDLIAGTKVVDS
jgi:uncharacterized RDD family membrane protein YckC